jgi:protein TonB
MKGNPPPRYPPQAVERSLEGVVLVAAHIGPDGAVERVEILESSGYPLLDREARRAVESWRFAPALRDGVPVSSRIEVPIRFRIS